MTETQAGKSVKLTHGGDIEGYLEEYGSAPLDFSANISPLGLPPGVHDAVIAALDTADAYPDPLCRRLRAALAKHDKVSLDEIVCGNGTADIIFRLGPALKPARALLCAPTFAEYAEGLEAAGCAIERHVLEPADGFAVDDRFIERIVPGIDLVFICQPNNPTGRTCPRETVIEALERCEAIGARLVVDECFVGFLDNPETVSVQALVSERPSLIVLKAFTKLYAMAGIRLGYALCADRAVVQAIQSTGQPWAVSTLAQAAGIAALNEEAYVGELRRLIRDERAFLIDGLSRCGLDANGEANFLFFHTTCTGFPERMRANGVLVRDCSNYPGLEEGWYRVAVRGHEENVRLLATISKVLGETDTEGDRR